VMEPKFPAQMVEPRIDRVHGRVQGFRGGSHRTVPGHGAEGFQFPLRRRFAASAAGATSRSLPRRRISLAGQQRSDSEAERSGTGRFGRRTESFPARLSAGIESRRYPGALHAGSLEGSLHMDLGWMNTRTPSAHRQDLRLPVVVTSITSRVRPDPD